MALSVTNGLFSVLLGDTSLGGMTKVLGAADLPTADTDDAFLRVWFSASGKDGSFTWLQPDRRIASAPYALIADQARAATSADLLDDLHASAFQQHYANVVVVAKSGSIPVTIEVGAEREHLVFEVDLSFQRGRIRVGNGLYEEHESRESPHYEGFRSLAPTGVGPPERTGYFAGMLEDAVACALDPARRPRSDAADGLAALRFILSVVRRS